MPHTCSILAFIHGYGVIEDILTRYDIEDMVNCGVNYRIVS